MCGVRASQEAMYPEACILSPDTIETHHVLLPLLALRCVECALHVDFVGVTLACLGAEVLLLCELTKTQMEHQTIVIVEEFKMRQSIPAYL